MGGGGGDLPGLTFPGTGRGSRVGGALPQVPAVAGERVRNSGKGSPRSLVHPQRGLVLES